MKTYRKRKICSSQKIRMRMDKTYLNIKHCKRGNKQNNFYRRKKKVVIPSIECNESSKERCTPDSESTNSSTKQYIYYDDFNLNFKLKPLQHPYTKKAKLFVLERFYENKICKSKSLLLQNDCKRVDKNMSLDQISDKPNNSCLALTTTVLQSHHKTLYENNSSLDDESSSNEDSDLINERSVTSRPNRRFIVEKTNTKVFNGSSCKIKTSFSHKTKSTLVEKKSHKGSEMWLDILNTPDLWKTETLVGSHSDFKSTSYEVTNDENTMDFDEMIADFIDLKNKQPCNWVDEDDFEEELAALDFTKLPIEFYIPPAKWEVIYSKLTPDMSQQDCLSLLCTEMEWLQPTYTVVRKNEASVLFSCNLKSKLFNPKRAGQSMDLNKELAAFECLTWLGFQTKERENAYWRNKNCAYYNS